MSRTQYLKSLERNLNNATKTINELTRENYELKRMLSASTKNNNEAQQKFKEAA